MSRIFYLVTPCGGTQAEAETTIDSVIALAGARESVIFRHLLIFNNGVTPGPERGVVPDNYQPQVFDIGHVASRAIARNTGLDEIEQAGQPGLVCFLDAGDIAVDGPALDIIGASWPTTDKRRLWAFSAAVAGSDIRAVRKPRSLWLREINNPFLIGATYVSTALAVSERFVEGAKEDWKYWLELLSHSDMKRDVSLHDAVAYEYQVVSTADHLRRKGALWRDQYRFFSDYLGHGHRPRTWASMMLHMMIAGTAWIRRSTHLQPWRRTT